ncbi:zinc finger CCCH domain-containing protein 10-like [Babylonia areolata]|uniref:zinc finger CCCH domain-containing protein 10-like n=1 Tax=Babylonia areolata TaxID=304850 RepID=UPI003FD20FF9
MSENSDSGSDDVRSSFINGGSDQDDICRDFLRNVCRRGKRCKYRHPAGAEDSNDNFDMGSSSKPEPTFCHDFQNMGCHRPTCKFLHCTREEEEHYHQTGQLPPRMQPHFGPGGGSNANNSDIPLCRDYMKGDCKRGAKCKYRHINNDYPECDPLPRCSDMGGGPPGRLEPLPRHDLRPDMRPPPPHSGGDMRNNHHGFNNFEDNYDKYERYEYIHGGPNHHGPPPPSDGGHSSMKRRRLDMEGFGGNGNYDSRYGSSPASSSSRPVSYQYQVLEEENTALRRRVEELKKQVADLTATNEVLLEQNARLRVAKSSTVSAVQMPVTQTLAPAGTLNLATMAPATAMQATALGTAHLSTNLTQQIALNSDMATQHAALQSAAQRMAREIQHQQVAAAAAATAAPPRPQGGQPPPALGAAPPPAMNPTVTMNPPLASLSMPQNNLVAVSLPSLVTPAPLQQVPGGSMAQNLGPPSNPLVSYPIMSQDMRCAVAPSSLAH